MLYKNLSDTELTHVMRMRRFLDYLAAFETLVLNRNWGDFKAIFKARRAFKAWKHASILHTAHTLMGVPYLWAGTSAKGVDCSGFVRTVFYLHDILLPRDASQQASVGQRLDIAPDFKNLQPGDLLFFGRKATTLRAEGISHVGIYIGQGRFIHAQGDVHVSSLISTDSLFDAFNLNRLLFATRVLP